MTGRRFHALTLNVRNAQLSGMSWKSRRRPLADWILSTGVDMVMLQEIPDLQLGDTMAYMGTAWSWSFHQEVAVGWIAKLFTSGRRKTRTLPGPQARGFIAQSLTTREWEDEFWLCSTHLTSSRPDAAWWRRKQLCEMQTYFNPGECARVVLGADLSSVHTPPQRGARRNFQNLMGLTHLRCKLRSSELIGEDWNTLQRFRPGRAEGEWAHDILTGSQIHPYMGRVMLTEKLTDSNGIKVGFSIGDEVPA